MNDLSEVWRSRILKTAPTSDLIRELEMRSECIAIEPLKPPADIFPWYMVQHMFDQYYEISRPGKIVVVLEDA